MKNIFNLLNTKRVRIIRLLNLAFILCTFVFINISNAHSEKLVQNISVNDELTLEQIDEYTYQTNVGDDFEHLDVYVVPTSENSTVKVFGNDNLIQGLNKVEIKVEDEKNNIKFYTINVQKS